MSGSPHESGYKFGYLNKIDTKKIKIVKGNMTLESAQLLQKFFQNKR